MDLYKLLGIDPSATQDDIRKAYKRAALKSHPDKVPAELRPQAEVDFKAVAEAYEVLGDPKTRAVYDRYGLDGVRGGEGRGSQGGQQPFHHYDPFDLFRHVFGDHDPFEHLHRSMFGNDPFGNGPFGNDPFGNDPFGRPFGNSSYSRGHDPFFNSPFGGMMGGPSLFGQMGGGSSTISSFSSSNFSGGRLSGGGFTSTSSQTTFVNGERTTVTTTRDASGNTRTETVKVGRDGRETREVIENGQKVIDAGMSSQANLIADSASSVSSSSAPMTSPKSSPASNEGLQPSIPAIGARCRLRKRALSKNRRIALSDPLRLFLIFGRIAHIEVFGTPGGDIPPRDPRASRESKLKGNPFRSGARNIEYDRPAMSRVIFVTALYDYAKPDDSGLSFKRGQVIQVHNQLESGWWDGSCNGERGWFPSNYVSEPEETVIDTPQAGPLTWVRQVTPDGRIYFINQFTGETTFEAPARSGSDSFTSSPRLSEASSLQQLNTPQTAITPGGLGSAGSIGGSSLGLTSGNRDSGYTTASNMTLPPGWIVFEAEDGSMVYYNGFTKETRWTPPEGTITSSSASTGSANRLRSTSLISARQAANEGLPPNWGRKQTPEGRVYYYNMLTDETTWNVADINMETGELLVKAKRDSTSNRSDSSADSNRRPSMMEEEAAGGRWTWSRLTNDIIAAITQLNTSSRHNYKEKFIPQSSAIVESIRVMLFASGTARRDAPLVESHRNLRVHHRNIMATLSKLVLSAKLASSVWPPPDAISKMQLAATDVLQAVKSFVAAAQEAGVEIRQDEGSASAAAAFTAAATAGEGPSAPSATGSTNGSLSRPTSQVSAGAASRQTGEEEEDGQPTNSEIISQLERYTSNVVEMIRALLHAVSGNEFSSSILITDVRSMVTEVGNFLAVVDDLTLDSLSEELTVDFKVNRLALYNSISGLVMATSTATGHFAPSNALEEVMKATGVVEKAVKDLLISTKFLFEEKEALEQQTLQQYIDQYGGAGPYGNGQNSPVTPTMAGAYGFSQSPSAQAAGVAQPNYGGYPQGPATAPAMGNLAVGSIGVGGPNASAALNAQRRPSEPQVRPRRALSLSILGPNLGEIPEGQVADGSVPGSVTGTPVSSQGGYESTASAPPSTVSNGRPSGTFSNGSGADDDELMASLSRANSRGKSNKIHKLLGADAPPIPKGGKAPVSTDNKPWYLSYDYSPDDIVFNMEGKVKGANLETLMERLTLHDQMDPAFLQTFLLTYRSFTASREFEALLEKRFMIQPPAGLTEEELAEWEKSKRHPIRLRVFNVMKSWIESYCQDDPEDREVLQTMRRFAMTTMQEAGAQTLAGQLVKLVERWEQSGGSIKKMVQSANPNVPPPILPRNLKRIRFLDLDALEVARQLTILEAKEYNKLQPVEFLLKAWSDKDNPVAVNVKTMILMSNQVAGWVAQSILSEKEVKKRANLIKHFISIADKCRSINNFNTLMSILAGLNSAPIHRLKRTWELLSQKAQATLESLRVTMNPTKNFSRYRETLHNVNPPCVPFLGFYLTDLTFIEDGSPNFLKGHETMINFSKRMKTAEVIREIQQYQNVPYQLTPVQELQEFLKQSFMETADETDLYNMSLILEPREREDEKIARLLSESGFL
ncbi:hypothetical protein HDU97_010059 [Phlyctochytrium planicorne]|nr:hypothetical protein HDU97_010059 [Phlyctochytrium planicorne]